MEKITFINSRGESIVFDGPPFYLISAEGLGDVSATIQRQKSPYQDGSTRIGSTLEERVLPIEFLIVGDNYAEVSEFRTKVSGILNPNLGEGILRYENGQVIREVIAGAESVPFFPDGSGNRINEMQKGLVTLVASNPYWRSLSITENPAFEPRFRFPFSGPFIMGVQRNDRMIHNDGDAPAPLKVNFYGPADSPYIENKTTGEFIRIKKRLEEGQTLKIDTTDGVKSLIYVDESGEETDVFNWIDLSSSFFKLQIGENDITCRCAISNNQKDFDIYYRKLYNAV